MAPESVDDYLAALPDAPREALAGVRATIRAAAPGAIETISYGMPTVKVGGRLLVSYAAFTKHCSLFPASRDVMAELGEQLAPYFAERSTLRFAPTDPIPAELLRRIVEVRLAEVSSA